MLKSSAACQPKTSEQATYHLEHKRRIKSSRTEDSFSRNLILPSTILSDQILSIWQKRKECATKRPDQNNKFLWSKDLS